MLVPNGVITLIVIETITTVPTFPIKPALETPEWFQLAEIKAFKVFLKQCRPWSVLIV